MKVTCYVTSALALFRKPLILNELGLKAISAFQQVSEKAFMQWFSPFVCVWRRDSVETNVTCNFWEC